MWRDYLQNTLEQVPKGKLLAGILGDFPSHYAKSPHLWNSAFVSLGIEAVYIPFDVLAADVAPFVESLRREPRLLGFNVTVPYKETVLDLLDQVDDQARQVGAVNTVVQASGQLIGYNTDGQGALDALAALQSTEKEPLFPKLAGKRVLVIGAGGSAKAVGHALRGRLQEGELLIANRSVQRAHALATTLAASGTRTRALALSEVAEAAAGAHLIMNTSTVGQSGLRLTGEGRATCLEPYSCLAPANPVELPAPQPEAEVQFYRRWYLASYSDITQNQTASLRAFAHIPADCGCFDLIYSPLETTFLRHARMSGHRTMNGKAMNVYQAAHGLVDRVCADWLNARGLDPKTAYREVVETMFRVW